MGEDHEEAHACYACLAIVSAFDVKAPCLTCAGEFASYCFKKDGSAGLSQEDSGKNGLV
jgi:hypothetical protein